MALISINPADGTELARYESMTEADVEDALKGAEQAARSVSAMTFADRAARMHRAADLLEARADAYAALMTREMGKPLAQARGEVRKCAWVCRWYADGAEAMLADEPVDTDASRSYVTYQPLGPVLAVMPWNFPFWQVFRFAAPALMAGNVGLLKHASNVTGCSLAIQDVLTDAGFGGGCFRSLLIGSDRIASLIDDDRIRAVTLTGSDAAGRAVGAAAGRAIKPSVLELGGSDPFIVLEDADMDAAVEAAVRGRMQNNGQSCIAAKRFIVERPVLTAFTERFVQAVGALRVGDPMDPDTDVGPLARADLVDEVHDQVRRAVADGAHIRIGGRAIDRPGFWYAPTILDGVEQDTVAFREEIFGPVASVIAADDENDAVRLANRSPFGLGGAVFTADAARGERVARALEVGCAFVNGMVKSDPRLPFGGVKASGYGRELALAGIRSFVNMKSVWVG